MKRFRIKQADNIKIDIRHKGQIITQSVNFSGFSSINEACNFVKNNLPWNFKGYGRKIEIAIHNMDTGQSKYLDTYS
jgi:hypothetical protein